VPPLPLLALAASSPSGQRTGGHLTPPWHVCSATCTAAPLCPQEPFPRLGQVGGAACNACDPLPTPSPVPSLTHGPLPPAAYGAPSPSALFLTLPPVPLRLWGPGSLACCGPRRRRGWVSGRVLGGSGPRRGPHCFRPLIFQTPAAGKGKANRVRWRPLEAHRQPLLGRIVRELQGVEAYRAGICHHRMKRSTHPCGACVGCICLPDLHPWPLQQSVVVLLCCFHVQFPMPWFAD
jgi:hypothetical protein